MRRHLGKLNDPFGTKIISCSVRGTVKRCAGTVRRRFVPDFHHCWALEVRCVLTIELEAVASDNYYCCVGCRTDWPVVVHARNACGTLFVFLFFFCFIQGSGWTDPKIFTEHRPNISLMFIMSCVLCRKGAKSETSYRHTHNAHLLLTLARHNTAVLHYITLHYITVSIASNIRSTYIVSHYLQSDDTCILFRTICFNSESNAM